MKATGPPPTDGSRPMPTDARALTRLPAWPADWSDAQLLDRFVAARDEAAFAALVDRHGPMVLGVCRRRVRNPCDAEDAFQATFLALARQAAGLRRPGALAAWLPGVARRVAGKVRPAPAPPDEDPDVPADSPGPPDEASWREVRQALDEELNRLPERFRGPLVLCYLEGHTRDSAARLL